MKVILLFIILLIPFYCLAAKSLTQQWLAFETLITQNTMNKMKRKRESMLQKGELPDDVEAKINQYVSLIAGCEIQQLKDLASDPQLKTIAHEVLTVVADGGTYQDYWKTFDSAEKRWVKRSKYGYILPLEGSEDAARRLNEIVEKTGNCLDDNYEW